jgi:uncharacterized protein YgfB (UPF0149 family)
MSKKANGDKDKMIETLGKVAREQAEQIVELEELTQSLKTIIWYLEIKIGLYTGEGDGQESI